MPKLNYTHIPRRKISHGYFTISVQEKSEVGSVLGYPRIKFECIEYEFISILPKFVKFLEDEDVDHFLHLFSEIPLRYIKYEKDRDPYVDSNSCLLYKIHSITYTNTDDDTFEVTNYQKYIE